MTEDNWINSPESIERIELWLKDMPSAPVRLRVAIAKELLRFYNRPGRVMSKYQTDLIEWARLTLQYYEKEVKQGLHD